MLRTTSIVGVLLVLVGLVFAGQGLGFLRGSSFMDGDVRWAVIGAVLAVVGAILIARDRMGRSPRP